MTERYSKDTKEVLNALNAVTKLPSGVLSSKETLQVIDGLATVAAHQAERDGETFIVRFADTLCQRDQNPKVRIDVINSAITEYRNSPDAHARSSVVGKEPPVRPDMDAVQRILEDRSEIFSNSHHKKHLDQNDFGAFWYGFQAVGVSGLSITAIAQDMVPTLGGKVVFGAIAAINAAAAVGLEIFRRKSRKI